MTGDKMVYIGLGSNLGNRAENIRLAVNLIQISVGKVIAEAMLRETEPWGFSSGNRFYNTVILVATTYAAEKVLETTGSIEEKLGRQRLDSKEYSDRLIDIDILDYNGIIIKNIDFELPHPRLHLRSFVLDPLEELNPNWIHPVFRMDIASLRKQFKTGLETIK